MKTLPCQTHIVAHKGDSHDYRSTDLHSKTRRGRTSATPPRPSEAATVEAGFPALSVYRKVLGPHGTMVTTQRWDSVATYDASRDQVRATRSITEIFERIYPVLASTHETEIYEEIDVRAPCLHRLGLKPISVPSDDEGNRWLNQTNVARFVARLSQVYRRSSAGTYSRLEVRP